MLILNLKNAGVILIGAMTLSFSFRQGKNQDLNQSAAQTVVRMDKIPRGVAYKVDSKPVGHTATTDILHALSQVKSERGSNAPVVVLVDPSVSITDIWNFEGVAGKAQLNNLRYFVFNRESGYMWGLKWGPAVPFSTNPN